MFILLNYLSSVISIHNRCRFVCMTPIHCHFRSLTTFYPLAYEYVFTFVDFVIHLIMLTVYTKWKIKLLEQARPVYFCCIYWLALSKPTVNWCRVLLVICPSIRTIGFMWQKIINIFHFSFWSCCFSSSDSCLNGFTLLFIFCSHVL